MQNKEKNEKIINLPNFIEKIEDALNGWQDNIKIDGKNIEYANVEQPSWIAYYDQLAVEVYYNLEYLDMTVKRVRAERMKFIKENSSVDYTDSAIQKLIDGDKEYIKYYEMYLIIKELYDKCKSIVEAFKQRSYSLNNIVKIRERELENITIRLGG